MTRPIRLGIVGCGEVTQVMHLPALAALPDLFEVTAICDVSATVVNGVGERWRITGRHADHAALLAAGQVDAVLIANPHVYHAETALAAMAAGKHVLVEKPMCLTPRDAEAMIAARREHGVVAQVGYMRRYAPAFLEGAVLVRALPSILMARIRDVIGRNALIMKGTSKVLRGHDLPASAGEAMRRRQAEAVREAIGDVAPDLVTAYMLMLGLASHDVSAMREMLGIPRRVLYAGCRHGGRWLNAAFDYGDFICQMEIGVDAIARMDSHIEVCSEHMVVRVEYDTPYIRHLPTRLFVTSSKTETGVATETSFPGRGDPFVAEWEAFHANIMGGLVPKTWLEDGIEDLKLFRQMAALMARAA